VQKPRTHGGRRSGAGRPKGSKNKATLARQSVAEILDIDVSETLDSAIHKRGHTLLIEMERIAIDPTQPIAARVMAARVALPFLLHRSENSRDNAVASEAILARLEAGRNRVAEAHRADRQRLVAKAPPDEAASQIRQS
jgi:hypothetical protein